MTPIVRIYLDVHRPGGGPCRLAERDFPHRSDDRLPLVAFDKFLLRVFWLDFGADPDGESVEWSAGRSISASLAIESALGAAEPQELVRTTGWTDNVEDGDRYYEALLDLTAVEIDEALGDSPRVDALYDVRVDEDGERATYRVPARLHRAALGVEPSGDEVALHMVNTAGAQVRQAADGKFHFYDYGQETWMEPMLEDGVLKWVEVPE